MESPIFILREAELGGSFFCDPAFCISLGFGEPHLVQLVEVAFYARIIKKYAKITKREKLFQLALYKTAFDYNCSLNFRIRRHDLRAGDSEIPATTTTV